MKAYTHTLAIKYLNQDRQIDIYIDTRIYIDTHVGMHVNICICIKDPD